MYWATKKRGVANIGAALQYLGWTIYGYDAGNIGQIGAYRAPSWQGVATHPDRDNVIVGVRVDEYTVEHYPDDWPPIQATPGHGWHIEIDGKIVDHGLAYIEKCSHAHDGDEQAARVAKTIDAAVVRALEKRVREKHADDLDAINNGTVRIEHDRDWTWVYFPSKPDKDVRDRLGNMDARWSKKREGWYFRHHVDRKELAWLFDEAT
ncbi:MAG: hypothetical protein U9Q82_08870, partial [Chloroflexota bacterium]|nr:hypothetical protein [Chloroflexota bacterium]